MTKAKAATAPRRLPDCRNRADFADGLLVISHVHSIDHFHHLLMCHRMAAVIGMMLTTDMHHRPHRHSECGHNGEADGGGDKHASKDLAHRKLPWFPAGALLGIRRRWTVVSKDAP